MPTKYFSHRNIKFKVYKTNAAFNFFKNFSLYNSSPREKEKTLMRF